jgi:starvation-inducible outer membrane lipoprotein
MLNLIFTVNLQWYGGRRRLAIIEIFQPALRNQPYDGKKVILAGDIVGEEKKPPGATQYRYPVVQVSELHLFHEKDDYRRYRPYDYQDGYGYPGYDQGPLKGIR